MAQTPAASPMSAERTAVLAEFARACRTAARSVSLYPATHPSIQASLSRVTAATGRLAPAGDISLTVHPDTLVIDGQVPARADQAIGEFAGLMHDRLVAALCVQKGADALDWHALLLLLARAPDELIAEGGIAKAWAAAGRNHFEIREIDYADVLRERGASDGSEWDQIISFCLQDGTGPLAEDALTALLETLGDSSRFGGLLERLQNTAAGGDATVSACAAVLLELIQKMLEATSQWPQAQGENRVLQTAADAASRLTPEMMLALIEQARAAGHERAEVASSVVDRIGDDTIASFVAGAVAREGGASDRLAQALQLLVPELDGKERLLDLAKQEAEQGPLGQQSGFEDLWQSATSMLTSYSDETYVSSDYARELSGAKAQAVDVERVSDDPPERIQRWLGTVDDDALRQLDLSLLLDLLQVEDDAALWLGIARIAVTEIEQRTKVGEVQDAQKLAFAIVRETSAGGRQALRSAAESATKTLASGPLATHIALHLRKVDDTDVEPFGRLCRTIGAPINGPLAEALMVETNNRAIRRLGELLFGFGAAGRETVGRLKQSSNPTVRRIAIEMLRMFGGKDALTDLAIMIEDTDPEVQRDAVRAIAKEGNHQAFAVLQKALIAGTPSSSTIPRQLISLREDSAVPLLCYVLNHSAPRGRLVEVHVQIIEALGALGAQPVSIQTLRSALYRAIGGLPSARRRCAGRRPWHCGASGHRKRWLSSRRRNRRAATAFAAPR